MSQHRHPLRTVRAATPHLTQAAFAAFLGVPVSVVQAVESGKGRMTPRLAAQIREMTGADEVELLRGPGGKALDLSGCRYTSQSYTAWVDSGGQAQERQRREAAQTAHRNAWNQYLREAVPGSNGGVPDADEITAVEDLLTPWQSCEFVSAPAAAWKRLPEGLLRLTGWSPDLSLPPRTRLSVSVQSAPSWNPDGAAPGFSAANAELFPPCHFTVAAGSGGCRVAAAFWQAVCREHAIHPETGTPLRESPSGSWRGFFRSQGPRCEPHAVFAGIDPAETADLHGGLFPVDGILCGPAGEELADKTLAFISEHSEDAGSPAGILLFASLEGGTASALSTLLLTRLRARFPTVPVMVAGVLPLSGVSQVVTAPWHTALAMQAIRRDATAALLFSNDLLLTQASRVWNLPSPGYAEANLLIAECLSALTAPLRFGGSDTPPADLTSLLACFPSETEGTLPLYTAHCWPLSALEDRRMKSLTLPWLVQSAAALAQQPPFAPAGESGLGVFLRVRLLPGSEWISTTEPPVIRRSRRTGTGLHESVSVVAPSPVIRRTLQRLARQAKAVWSTASALTACQELGVTPDEMNQAIRDMGR